MNSLNEMDEYFARNGDYIFTKENIVAKVTEQENKIKDLQQGFSQINQKLDSIILQRHNLKSLERIIPN